MNTFFTSSFAEYSNVFLPDSINFFKCLDNVASEILKTLHASRREILLPVMTASTALSIVEASTGALYLPFLLLGIIICKKANIFTNLSEFI